MRRYATLFILLGTFLAASGVYLMKRQSSFEAPAVTTPETRTFSWRFETTENEGDMAPRTTVALITGDKVYNLGGYMGTCAEILPENLLENEVSGVLCWYAGGGDELGVFKEGETFVVKGGVQEEPTAESEGFRGNFKTIVTLE